MSKISLSRIDKNIANSMVLPDIKIKNKDNIEPKLNKSQSLTFQEIEPIDNDFGNMRSFSQPRSILNNRDKNLKLRIPIKPKPVRPLYVSFQTQKLVQEPALRQSSPLSSSEIDSVDLKDKSLELQDLPNSPLKKSKSRIVSFVTCSKQTSKIEHPTITSSEK